MKKLPRKRTNVSGKMQTLEDDSFPSEMVPILGTFVHFRGCKSIHSFSDGLRPFENRRRESPGKKLADRRAENLLVDGFEVNVCFQK